MERAEAIKQAKEWCEKEYNIHIKNRREWKSVSVEKDNDAIELYYILGSPPKAIVINTEYYILGINTWGKTRLFDNVK